MTSQAARLKLVLVLTENWTMLPGTDVQGLVRMAREAEDSGFDAGMLSEHVVLGPDTGPAGLMQNPRDWAYPGNQDPSTPRWAGRKPQNSRPCAPRWPPPTATRTRWRWWGHPRRFPSRDAVADLGQAMEFLPEQWEQGFTTICIKPSMLINDTCDLPRFCREALRQATSLIG